MSPIIATTNLCSGFAWHTCKKALTLLDNCKWSINYFICICWPKKKQLYYIHLSFHYVPIYDALKWRIYDKKLIKLYNTTHLMYIATNFTCGPLSPEIKNTNNESLSMHYSCIALEVLELICIVVCIYIFASKLKEK